MFPFIQSTRLDQELLLTKNISSLIDLISRFLDFWSPKFQTYEDILQELATTLKGVGFSPNLLIEDLRDAHHAQEEDPIVSSHLHEDNTLVFSPPIGEDEEICERQERWEELSRKLKENVKEIRSFASDWLIVLSQLRWLLQLCYELLRYLMDSWF
jgi:hypothetical protein